MIIKPSNNDNFTSRFIFLSDEEAEYIDFHIQSDGEYCLDREDYFKIIDYRKKIIEQRINKLKKI
jgi:hypothetical protein